MPAAAHMRPGGSSAHSWTRAHGKARGHPRGGGVGAEVFIFDKTVRLEAALASLPRAAQGPGAWDLPQLTSRESSGHRPGPASAEPSTTVLQGPESLCSPWGQVGTGQCPQEPSRNNEK